MIRWSFSEVRCTHPGISRSPVVVLLLGLWLMGWGLVCPTVIQAQSPCPPTAPDMEGPYYKPSVPLRDKTGSGLVITGKVRTSGTCEAIAGARVEWWQASPEGVYDDDHRGALLSGRDGDYRLETDFPAPYYSRPHHVHFKVFAPGHRTLTTQVYPRAGQKTVNFDFVLIPEKGGK